MIDTKELRRLVEEDGKGGIELEEIHELLDRLEAAESDGLEQARLNGMGGEREAALLAKLEAAEKERDALRIELNEIRYGVAAAHDTIKALRAKIEAMEKQEPVAYLYEYVSPMDGKTPVWRAGRGEWNGQQAKSAKPLYALPGAKGEEK